MSKFIWQNIGAVLLFIIAIVAAGQQAVSESKTGADGGSSAKEALESLNSIIGEWRGVGQLRRGSTQGAWKETGEFVWDFSQPEPAVRYVVTEGKYAKEGRITWNSDLKLFELRLQPASGEDRNYTGNWQEKDLVFVSPKDADGLQHRLTITPLNDKRTLVLQEKTSPGGQAFFRVAEVGYTREGTHLAISGVGQRECVVTGGTGTMEVTYQGETYYVCCSGCRQAFQDDPAGVIAEFKERVRKRQDGKK